MAFSRLATINLGFLIFFYKKIIPEIDKTLSKQLLLHCDSAY